MQDYLLLLAGIVVGVTCIMGGIYVIYRRGIAIRLSAVQLACVVTGAVAAFILGREGMDWLRLGIALVVVMPILGTVFALTARWIVSPLKRLVAAAGGIAQGDVAQQVESLRRDELGDLAAAFQQMVAYLRDMAGAADRLSQGDLEVEVAPRSAEDVLSHTFRRMVAYQQEMAGAADRLAEGDLTVTIVPQSEGDRLANSFAQMVASLRAMVGDVATSADGVGAAAAQMTAAAGQSGEATAQVAATIQQVAQGTVQQTASVTTTVKLIEQMGRAIDSVARGAQEQTAAVGKSSQITAQITAAITQVAQNAQAGAEGSSQAAQTARTGAHIVEETIGGIEGIRAKVGFSVQKVREMGQRSEEIGTIIETIDGIAAQTNLLALNAAIEAARAGEHGKGFAVVADEVRKLAEKSADATKEIAALIKGIQRTVGEAVQAMDEGAREVATGAGRATEAGEALTHILLATEEVNRQMVEIAAAARQMDHLADELVSTVDAVSAVVEENTAATEEMAANSGEVSQAIENIAGISEENSASAEEVSASVEEVNAQVEEFVASAQSLSEMAQNLQALVGRFQLPDSGPRGWDDRGPARRPLEAAERGPHGRPSVARPPARRL